jgi:hypothetical protein
MPTVCCTPQENKEAIRPLIRQNMKKIDYFLFWKYVWIDLGSFGWIEKSFFYPGGFTTEKVENLKEPDFLLIKQKETKIQSGQVIELRANLILSWKSLISDSIIEHRVLDTRKFCQHFEYSSFRVIGPSNRVWEYCFLINVRGHLRFIKNKNINFN